MRKILRKLLFLLKVWNKQNVRIHKSIRVGKNVELFSTKEGSINISENFGFGSYSIINAVGGNIEIGKACYINTFCKIISMKRIKIGNNVSIGSYVSIIDHDHDIKYLKYSTEFCKNYVKNSIAIGDNVWIADKVSILKNVKIGNNVVIAANSVVLKDIPDNCIYGGIPSKLLKKID